MQNSFAILPGLSLSCCNLARKLLGYGLFKPVE
jgi:hypothetical protein